MNLQPPTDMKRHIAKLSMLTLCAAALLAVSALSRAQDATNTPAAPTKPVRKHAATSSATLPFRGTVTAVDTNAMTLAVGKRTFNMTSETKITKDGKPAVLADGVAGEPVSGAYKKAADGTLNATTVHFSTKSADKKKEAAAKGN
jgi:hypothetical protein